MRKRHLTGWIVLAALLAPLLFAAQSGTRRWAMYEDEMQDPVDDPPDALEPAEFAFGRLRYRARFRGFGGYERWGIDANKSDRQFIQGVRRLTRVHARSIEEILDVDSDEMFNWPWIFAVAAGDWTFTDDQAARLRRYLERGGFLMVDDFHGEREWQSFMAGMRRVLPDAEPIELEDDAAIFHTVYDLNERINVPGANVVHGPGYERDGTVPHWRAILDSKGRIMVAICFNMDVGDAWEFADSPDYPEKYASMAYRLGINYVLYSMTH
jgi:hypothetical protein